MLSRLIEHFALWLALVRPSAMQRFREYHQELGRQEVLETAQQLHEAAPNRDARRWLEHTKRHRRAHL